MDFLKARLVQAIMAGLIAFLGGLTGGYVAQPGSAIHIEK